jgi:hypothetical protein
MTLYDVPAEFQDKLKNAMKDESGVKLPFAAPTMWWMNGKPALKSTKQVEDATRFGGWGISKEEIDGFGSDLAEVPSYWQLHEDLANGQGKTYSAYLCRTAWVAPIARRSGWFEYDGKSRSAINILCYLALFTQRGAPLAPFGPVVLSAKSFTGVDLDKCFKDFAAKSAQLRGSTPPNFFFHPIGTWGSEPVFSERKGKNGASSSVTPPQLYLPPGGLIEELLTKWFVGPDVAREMAGYLDQAQDWIADWKNRGGKKEQPVEMAVPETRPLDEDDFPY